MTFNQSENDNWLKEHLRLGELEKARLKKDMESGKEVPIAYNIFGPESVDAHAYIDLPIINPETGGTFTKLYGCPFKVKGISPFNVVEGFQLPKHLFSGFPRDIVKNSKLLALFLVLTWLLDRKGFLGIIEDLLKNIEHRVIKPLAIWSEVCYNDLEKELERSLLVASQGEGVWEGIVKLALKFLKPFLFIDNTYKFRVQDWLGEIKGNGIKEFWRTFKILREREQGIHKTWRFIEYALRFALFTSPTLKRILTKFIDNLDVEKVKMDEDDYYFAIRFKSYNFKGKTYEERKVEWAEMNAKNHVIFLR